MDRITERDLVRGPLHEALEAPQLMLHKHDMNLKSEMDAFWKRAKQEKDAKKSRLIARLNHR